MKTCYSGFFPSRGEYPCSNTDVNIFVIGLAITEADNFSNFGPMLSSPQPFESSNAYNPLTTYWHSIGGIWNNEPGGTFWFTKFCRREKLWSGLVFRLNLSTILEKYSLKISAIVEGSVI